MYKIIKLCIIVLLPSTGLSQTLESASSRLNSLSDAQAGAPGYIDPLQTRNSIEMRSGSDNNEASIHFGFNHGTKESWNFSFTTPIDRDEKEGILATLDGLSNSLRFKTSFNYFLTDLSDYIVDEKGKKDVCLKAGGLYGWSTREAEQNFYDASRCEDLIFPDGSTLDSLFKSRELISVEKKEDIEKQLLSLQRKWRRAGMGYKHTKNKGKVITNWVTQIKSDIVVGSERFKYIQTDLSTEKDETETEWSVNLGIRWVNFVNRYSVGVDYRYEKVYDDSPMQNVCTSTDVDNVQLCKNISVGGPKQLDRELGVLNLDLIRSKWALSSILSYEFETDEYGLEIPIYFTRHKNQLLNGGVSFGWTSMEKELSAQIFIGAPFSIFD